MWVLNHLPKLTVVTLTSLWFWSAVAVAEVQERNLTIDASSSSYSVLVQRAEALAKQSINQAFQENSTLESITIMISGERRGRVAPLLRTRVTRRQWQENQDVSEWTRYFVPAESLLGYNDAPPTPAPSRSTPAPRPRPQQTRSQPSASPTQTTPTSPSPTQTTSQPTSPQVQPSSEESPNIIRLEPRRGPSRNSREDDPGFRDD
ncbi:MAG: hypothetical protein SWJ54_21745 [Cyanobacteriota bacterium]|nr:hypothetical protein [Cyanobacteriota bacterium]